MSVHGSQYVDITCVNASGDLTSSQFYFVKSTGVDTTYSAGNLTCKVCDSSTGGTGGVKGILQNEPDTGQAAIVRVSGASKLVAGEAIAVGDLVQSGTDGRGLICDSSGSYFLARAESASTAAGQVISVRLCGPGVWMGSTA